MAKRKSTLPPLNDPPDLAIDEEEGIIGDDTGMAPIEEEAPAAPRSDPEPGGFADRQANLPDKGAMSEKELTSIESMYKVTMEDLLPRIGVQPYNNWDIRVWRNAPSFWEGLAIASKAVDRIRSGMTMKEMEEKITSTYGGGIYTIKVVDQLNVCRKQFRMEIDGPPLWPDNIYPELAAIRKRNDGAPAADTSATERAAAMQIGFMSQQLDAMKDQVAAQAAREYERDRQNKEDRDREREEHRREMQELKASILGQPSKTSEMAPLMSIIQEGNRAAMQMQSDNMKMQFEALKAQSDMQMRMYEKLSVQAPNNDNDMVLRMLEMASNEKSSSMDTAIKLIGIMAPLMEKGGGGGEEGETPASVQIMEAVGHIAEKVTGTITAATELRKLGKPPQIQRKPGQAPPPKPNGPAPKPAGGEAPPKPEEPIQVTPDMIRSQYAAAPLQEKIRLMISALLMEIDETPAPDKAFWTELVDHRNTPNELIGTILERGEEEEGLKGLVLDLVRMHEPESLPQVEPVLGTPKATAWLKSCYEYIEDRYADDEEDDAPEPATQA